jgi:hypothetical protein
LTGGFHVLNGQTGKFDKRRTNTLNKCAEDIQNREQHLENRERLDYFTPKKITGKGFVDIGNKKIHLDSLLIKNKIDLRHPSGCNIHGFGVMTVSDHMLAQVNKLIHRKKPLQEDIDDMNSNEKQLMEKLMQITGLARHHDEKSIEKKKQRWQLIVDEIQAGNDNKELRNEAKEILSVFQKQGLITQEEKKKFTRQLKSS